MIFDLLMVKIDVDRDLIDGASCNEHLKDLLARARGELRENGYPQDAYKVLHFIALNKLAMVARKELEI